MGSMRWTGKLEEVACTLKSQYSYGWRDGERHRRIANMQTWSKQISGQNEREPASTRWKAGTNS